MTEYQADNIFAKILKGDLPAAKVLETDDILVIMDVMPQSKGHCLVIPKAPSRNILDADDRTIAAAVTEVARVARAAKAAFAADGISIMQFNEAAGGQTVFHLHFHVVPRYDGAPLRQHGSGGMEDAAVLADQASAIRAQLSNAS